MNEPVISVVVPIYKAEEYLPTCISCVLSQTFTDYELLLINDASPDNSGKMCDEFAATDSRIKVFHQKKNGGESIARNVGLDNASGKYILFVDADDRILPNYIESLYYSTDIPAGTLVHAPVLREVYGVTELPNKKPETYFIDDFTAPHGKTEFLFAGPAWSKLLEVKLIRDNNLHFKTDIKMNVDHTFHLEYLLHINAYKNIGEATYIYIKRDVETLSSRAFPYEDLYRRLYYMVPLTRQVVGRFNVIDKQLLNNVWFTPFIAAFNCVFSLYKAPYKKEKKERITCLKNVMDNYRFLFTDHYKTSGSTDKAIRSVLLLRNYSIMDTLLQILTWVRYSLIKK